MKAQIQANYEKRLKRYAALVHGNEPLGLVAKLATYSSLLKQHKLHGDGLLKIEPLLYPLIQAVEIDLHLAVAKLLEDPKRSDRSLFKFLEFCLTNRTNISWQGKEISEDLLLNQRQQLETHRTTINSVMGRRDKFFAHLDKRYFNEPSRIYTDFPLREEEVIALANCVIGVVSSHQTNLGSAVSFHAGEFYTIAVENMVRNLEAGRKMNFPGQLEQ
ncbi:hypothetical protein EFQ99_00035 [Rhizobium vallis]|uniref:HEPN AbiU2-like domain-containing protein n=1 Tax=Rhizobium vallis TaxID=634290 RepID=A0A432PQ91_9HYPH|nr:hypothetical protein [Rhizobium vallis]RUM26640.1 hypothetical protein EFQ99_00035 [Rhizobium vallis]